MSFVELFGKYLLANLLREWFYLEDVCNMDTAVCSQVIRQVVLDCVSMKEVVLAKKCEHFSKSYFNWLRVRLVKTELEMNAFLFEFDTSSNFEIVANAKSIKCENSRGIFAQQWSLFMCKIVRVEFVVLKNCNFADKIILEASVFWVNLNLDLSNITDASLIFLVSNCAHLHSISVNCCDKLTDVGITHVAKTINDRLFLLDITYCDRITNTSLIAIAEHCPNIRNLSVGFLKLVTSEYFINLFTKCKMLTSLYVREGHNSKPVTNDDVIITVGKHCTQLTTVNLRTNKIISDVGIEALCAGCPLITNLDLNSMTNITLQSIVIIANKLHHLNNITYSNGKDFNYTAFQILAPKFDHIFFIDMDQFGSIRGVPSLIKNPTEITLPNNMLLSGSNNGDFVQLILANKEKFQKHLYSVFLFANTTTTIDLLHQLDVLMICLQSWI
jgi:hypothetical protein